MRFFNNPLVADPHCTNHQQAHVAHDVVDQLGIGNILAVDIQTELLPLQASTVAEVDLEIEHHAFLCARCGAHFAGVRWLTATLPRISRPAAIMVGVTGSLRNSQAKAAPNSGTR